MENIKVYIVHEAYEPKVVDVFFSEKQAMRRAQCLVEYNAYPKGYFWVKEYEISDNKYNTATCQDNS